MVELVAIAMYGFTIAKLVSNIHGKTQECIQYVWKVPPRKLKEKS